MICIQQSFHYTPLGHKIEIQFDYMFLQWIASWDIGIVVFHQCVVKLYHFLSFYIYVKLLIICFVYFYFCIKSIKINIKM